MQSRRNSQSQEPFDWSRRGDGNLAQWPAAGVLAILVGIGTGTIAWAADDVLRSNSKKKPGRLTGLLGTTGLPQSSLELADDLTIGSRALPHPTPGQAGQWASAVYFTSSMSTLFSPFETVISLGDGFIPM